MLDRYLLLKLQRDQRRVASANKRDKLIRERQYKIFSHNPVLTYDAVYFSNVNRWLSFVELNWAYWRIDNDCSIGRDINVINMFLFLLLLCTILNSQNSLGISVSRCLRVVWGSQQVGRLHTQISTSHWQLRFRIWRQVKKGVEVAFFCSAKQ